MNVSILPTINASLNAAAAILLVLGLLSIKRDDVRSHRACMSAAFVVSVVFLACYLYYHSQVPPTKFTGGGEWVRRFYYAILFTHIPLAGLVPVLALRLFYLAYKRRFKRHAALARWAFPIWMYVSVTGVVIYVMLYHLYPAR